jgi:hypothetical protein
MSKTTCGDSIRVVQTLFQVEDEGSSPISPLHFEIEEIPIDLARSLNRFWHSRLPEITKNTVHMNTHKICFGAKYKNYWFASAIWTDPIALAFNGLGFLELRRLAISPDSPKNTASRMLSIMVKMIKVKFPNVWKLISYQDTEVHHGTIYKASGWEYANLSGTPNWYSPDKKYRNRVAHTNPIVSNAPKVRWEKQIRNEIQPIVKEHNGQQSQYTGDLFA